LEKFFLKEDFIIFLIGLLDFGDLRQKKAQNFFEKRKKEGKINWTGQRLAISCYWSPLCITSCIRCCILQRMHMGT